MNKTTEPTECISTAESSLIRSLRESLQLSRYAFCCITGMKPERLKAAEEGRMEVKPETLRRIAERFGLTVVLESKNPQTWGGIQGTAQELAVEARKSAGLSQVRLAEKSKIGQSLISDYEGGRREPGYGQLRRLLEAAGRLLLVRFSPKTT